MTRRSLLLALCLIFLSGCQDGAEDMTAKVVGTWKYDTDTLRLELAPDLRKDMEAHGDKGAAAMEKSKAGLIKSVQSLVFVFNADGTMQFGMAKTPEMPIAKGKWFARGRSINLEMITPGQTVPDMTIEPDGQRIKTVTKGDFGAGYIDLVKQ